MIYINGFPTTVASCLIKADCFETLHLRLHQHKTHALLVVSIRRKRFDRDNSRVQSSIFPSQVFPETRCGAFQVFHDEHGPTAKENTHTHKAAINTPSCMRGSALYQIRFLPYHEVPSHYSIVQIHSISLQRLLKPAV